MLKALIDRQKYSMARKAKLDLRRGCFIFDNELTSSDGIKTNWFALYGRHDDQSTAIVSQRNV